MCKNVILTVIGTQTNEWGEKDTIELITLGNLYVKNNSIYLLYNETAVSGMEGTTTSVKAEPRRVTLNRMGSAELKQIFEVGILNDGNYVTPFGIMPTRVLPSKVEVDLTEMGGSINLEYELELGQHKVSYNELSITVKEV